MKQTYSVITASGSYIPTLKIDNEAFLSNQFYDQYGVLVTKTNEEIIGQFEKITGIKKRRYASRHLVASDLGFYAGRDALARSGTDKESLDYIIVAHNFGDIRLGNPRSEFVPTLAARIKNHLGISNPDTIAYDLPFGCAGWLQGVIQADTFIRSGIAKRIMVIGAETLSRVCDPHDRDSMIYADGAGALILQGYESENPVGILAHTVKSYTDEVSDVLKMGVSSNPAFGSQRLFLKMNGRKLYEHALKTVPHVIKECLDKAEMTISDIDKILIHQANEKMDDAILRNLFDLYDLKVSPDHFMPMTISWLGNSSVATLPTMFDLISKGEMENQHFYPGMKVTFASVGAGVNMNAVAYKFPE